jgi:O-antigen/teichoic acid export membrane protein
MFRVAEVLAGISLLAAGFGLISLALVHALSWWCQSVYGYWLVQTHLPGIRFRARFREQWAVFRLVLPVAIASIGATWLMQGPFVLYKDKASVLGDLGVVALVLQIFILAAGIPVALGRAALPALSRAVVRTDDREALFLGTVLRAAIAGTTGLVIVASATGDWMVPLVFGAAYSSAGVYLAFGMIAVLPFGVATIANQILIAHGRTWHAMASAVTGAVAMTAFVHVFMPASGSITVYFTCIIAGMVIWAITALGLLSRCVAVDSRQCLAKPALASGLSLALYFVLAALVGPLTGLVSAVTVLVWGQLAFGIVEPRERDALSRHVLARRGGGSHRE